MFSLFHRKPTYRKAGYFNGFTDWHCHILPGVDDGVKTMETALEILGEYDRLGFSDVWLTRNGRTRRCGKFVRLS